MGVMIMAKHKPTQYAWQDLEYTPYYLNKHTVAELRKEYSKLRSIVRKRQERLEQSEFAELAGQALWQVTACCTD